MKFNKAKKNLISEQVDMGVKDSRVLNEYLSKSKIDIFVDEVIEAMKYTQKDYKTPKTLSYDSTISEIEERYHEFKAEYDFEDDREYDYRDDNEELGSNEMSDEFVLEILQKIRDKGYNVGRDPNASKRNFDY